MALFKARIKVIAFVDIPVFAEDAESAARYMASTDEWVADGGLYYEKSDDTDMSVVGIEVVTDPTQAPDFTGDDLCWGESEALSVAEAFYDYNRASHSGEVSSDVAWAKLHELCELFDYMARMGKEGAESRAVTPGSANPTDRT